MICIILLIAIACITCKHDVDEKNSINKVPEMMNGTGDFSSLNVMKRMINRFYKYRNYM